VTRQCQAVERPAVERPACVTLIETYLHRRFELEPRVRNERADQIVRRITEKTGLGPDSNQPADDFLEAVARQIRDTARFR
jgi:hypothetical protein